MGRVVRISTGWIIVVIAFATAVLHCSAAAHNFIATGKIVSDAPLVTANVKDFSRVPGLRVIGY